MLKNRKVIIYPDLNAFDAWALKAQQLKHITRFAIADILEKETDHHERQKGFDLADYLISIYALQQFPVDKTVPLTGNLLYQDYSGMLK